MAGRHRRVKGQGGRHRQPPGASRFVLPGLLAVAIVGAGVTAEAAFTGDSTPATQPLGRSPAATAPATAPTPTVTVPASGSPTAPAPSSPPSSPAGQPVRSHPAALVLRIAGGVSWVEARGPSGHLYYSGILRNGHRLVLRRAGTGVVVGNAGAVRISRHGSAFHRLGRPGEVLVLRVR